MAEFQKQYLEKICCENCGHPLIDSFAQYTAYGISINAGTVLTLFGSVHLSPAKMLIFYALLRAYPKVVRHDSLTYFYETHLRDIVKESSSHEGSVGTLRVYITTMRKDLQQIGLSIDTQWGYGYALNIPSLIRNSLYDRTTA